MTDKVESAPLMAGAKSFDITHTSNMHPLGKSKIINGNQSGFNHIVRDPTIVSRKTSVMDPSFYVRSVDFGNARPPSKLQVNIKLRASQVSKKKASSCNHH